MPKCALCKNEAVYKDKKTISKDGIERYVYYCKQTAEVGVAFGFIDREDLIPIRK